MTFKDIESAREFYKGYAAHVGFPVCISQLKAQRLKMRQSEPVRSGKSKCGRKKNHSM
jgi:hypothetical protein